MESTGGLGLLELRFELAIPDTNSGSVASRPLSSSSRSINFATVSSKTSDTVGDSLSLCIESVWTSGAGFSAFTVFFFGFSGFDFAIGFGVGALRSGGGLTLGLAFAGVDRRVLVAVGVTLGLAAGANDRFTSGVFFGVIFGRVAAPSGSVRADVECVDGEGFAVLVHPSRDVCRLRDFGVTRPLVRPWPGLLVGRAVGPAPPSPFRLTSRNFGVANRLICSVDTVRRRNRESPFSLGGKLSPPSGLARFARDAAVGVNSLSDTTGTV